MRNLPVWLKFGLLISIPVTLFSALAPNCYLQSEGEPWGCLIYLLPNFHIATIVDSLNLGTRDLTPWIIILVGGFITWFSIGALIGIFISRWLEKTE